MRKLQITILYFLLLMALFFIPKPKSLLKIETYESKMRNINQNQDRPDESIVVNSSAIDSFSYIQRIP